MNAVVERAKQPAKIADRLLELERDCFAGLLFARTTLGADHPLEAELVGRHVLALENREVSNAALRCQSALLQLMELLTAPSALVSLGVDLAHAEGVNPVEVLDRLTGLAEGRIKKTKAEFQRSTARQRDHRARVQPLRIEVSNRQTKAQAELSVLNERRLLLRDAPPQNDYQRLLDAGLSPEDIAKLGRANPVGKAARERERMQSRVLILQREIAACQAFNADPRHDPAHLEGVPGFADLISAQRACEGPL